LPTVAVEVNMNFLKAFQLKLSFNIIIIIKKKITFEIILAHQIVARRILFANQPPLKFLHEKEILFSPTLFQKELFFICIQRNSLFFFSLSSLTFSHFSNNLNDKGTGKNCCTKSATL
jgi:hypothetical protein